ncbi:Holliday junction resolvase RuvX [soil metagenome]
MILGVDPGTRRIGLAIADEVTRFARPLEVVDASAVDPVARIAQVVADKEVTKVVVGRPAGLSGRGGPAVTRQSELVARLREHLEVEVDEFDERLTTVVAERALRSGGARPAARRRILDAVAAQVMLQGFLDASGPPRE